ncbi:MAG: chemotaxis protein CheW [Pseudoxanthomonas sp.]|nr:chemotaxis protein CheW [Pseudoxanthomonas sp.]MDZ3797472.1 chemotaxis protein CheW [Xanthomonadales bacterium]TXI25872.1 MAG: chemotaxis protein CheW [Ottowia sp.]MBP7465350.1 chemotaxis protein CheW [Pseudoxanthomonas sp.]MBP8740940.1 chemotaxis protein CheW [Pseudoxanthomonas sp.]
MAYNSDEIRGVMIQVGDDRLLLPNATVAEVLAKVPVEPVEDAPDWLPGRIDWHGWQVPLVKFATLAGLQEDAAGRGNRVIVLKALGGDEALPYFGLLTASFPQLVSVPRDSLLADASEDDLPRGIQMRVLLGEQSAMLPDLELVERMVAQALAAAA